MGSRYLSSIMKAQTSIFILVVSFTFLLYASHVTAKNVPMSEVEIEKDTAEAFLQRNKRGWFSGEEKKDTRNDYDDDDYYNDDYDDDNTNYETNDNREDNRDNGGKGNGKGIKDWIQLISGIIALITN